MIKELLTDVIESHQNLKNQVASKYNIFQVLQLKSEEVRLHSRFLADILNPRGNHELGTFFLESFLKLTKENTIFPNLNLVELYVEKYVGPVTSTTGGQIDILLQDNQNNALIIENKIYAGDQENQLLRYRNFGKQLESRGGKFHIVYLTLHGNCASAISLGKAMEHEEYECISYKYHIINWLENCIKQLSENAQTSVILTHYTQLLKDLTGMENNNLMDFTITDIIKSKEYFSAAKKITNALLPAKCYLLKHAMEDIVSQLKLSYPQLMFPISDRFGFKYEGMEIHHTIPKGNDHSSHIRFSFLNDASECYIEIHPGLNNGIEIPKNHENRLNYIQELNPYFPSTTAKIMNVENYWQGEWVIHYYPFNDVFEKLLDDENKAPLINQVCEDLSLIINAFLKNATIKEQSYH